MNSWSYIMRWYQDDLVMVRTDNNIIVSKQLYSTQLLYLSEHDDNEHFSLVM